MRKLFFSLLIMTGIICNKAVVAQTESSSVTLDLVQPADADLLVIQVKLQTAGDARFGASAFALTYNSAALDPVECQVGTNLFGVCNAESPGEILFNAIDVQGATGQLTLLEVAFQRNLAEPLNIELMISEAAVNELGEQILLAVDQAPIDAINQTELENLSINESTAISTQTPSPTEATDQTRTPAESTEETTEQSEEAVDATPVSETSAEESVPENLPTATPAEESAAAAIIPTDPPTNLEQNEMTEEESVAEENIEGEATPFVSESVEQVAAVSEELLVDEGQNPDSAIQIGGDELRSDSNAASESPAEQSSNNQFLWFGFIGSFLLFLIGITGFFLIFNSKRA
ncbi:MAG: hypothetical protein AAGD96_03895 [Chloroflexota bacterium]